MTPTAIAILVLTLLAMSSVLAYVVAQNTGSRARLRMRLAAIAGDVKEGPGAKKGAAPKGRNRRIKSKLEEAGGGAAPSRRVALRLHIDRAGLAISVQTFYLASAVSGIVGTGLFLLMGYSWYWSPGVLIVMGLGFPRKVLKSLSAKRQKRFTQHFADAIDVIVRGIKSGLPVGECLNIIARENRRSRSAPSSSSWSRARSSA